MVKVTVKGGVWKNAEDEILKAAVMKYGLNSWERISSLLVQKTAIQCKARWFEWLDPSINKTDWTRQEDERLLQLCKVFPSQWRTISSMVGRTAFQCLERFNILLASGESALETADVALAESLPSRPDLAKMPQEDVAMIDEARARIANIKGRKDRRKEKQRAADAVRQAAMAQRNRELSAAGLVKKLPDAAQLRLTKSLLAVQDVQLASIAETDAVPRMSVAEMRKHIKSAEPVPSKEDRKPARQAKAFKSPDGSEIPLNQMLDLPPVLARADVGQQSRDVAALLAELPDVSLAEEKPEIPRRKRGLSSQEDVAVQASDAKRRQVEELPVTLGKPGISLVPRPGSRKLVALYKSDLAALAFATDAVGLMIRDAVWKPVPISGRPPGVSEIPSDAIEEIDAECMQAAIKLLDTEAGLADLSRERIDEFFESAEFGAISTQKLAAMTSRWESERASILTEKERMLSVHEAKLGHRVREVEELRLRVALLEAEEKLVATQMDQDAATMRDLIHQWAKICEQQRNRKRELTSQLV